MADKKTAEPEPAPAPEPAPVAEPVLGAAGESADPAVHQVLAERETAISNGDDAAAAALTERLAALGVK